MKRKQIDEMYFTYQNGRSGMHLNSNTISKYLNQIPIELNSIQKATKFNSSMSNITFLHGNSASSNWGVDYKFDAAFIDADHSYAAVIKDIGEPKGNEPRIGKPLLDWEGVICQVI